MTDPREPESPPSEAPRPALDPPVRFRNSSAPPMLEAPSMTVAYTPWDLWFGNRRSIEVTLDRPIIRLRRGADGKVRLPLWKSGPKAPSGPQREVEVLFHLRE